MAALTGCALRLAALCVLPALLLVILGIVLGGSLQEGILLYAGSSRSLDARSVSRPIPPAVVLHDLPSAPVSFDWSPDGRRISYTLLNANQYSLWIYDVHSRHRLRVADGLPPQRGPAWLPDGAGLALLSAERDLCLFTWEGTALRCLGLGPIIDFDGSPQGTAPRLAYLQWLGSDAGLFTVDLSSGTPHLLTRLRLPTDPRWSPDGRRIAVTVFGRMVPTDLHVIDAATGESQVYPLTGQSRGMSWHPDGERIAYLSDLGFGEDVFLVDLASGGEAQITDLNTNLGAVRWSPDGTALAYVSRTGSRAADLPAVYLLSDASGVVTQVGPAYSFQLAWRP